MRTANTFPVYEETGLPSKRGGRSVKDMFTGKVYAYMYPAALSAPSVADMTFLPT